MPHNRFFLEEPLLAHTTVSLEGAEAHHLQHVMRIQIGEQIELVNGRHQHAVAEVIHLHKKTVTLYLLSVETHVSGSVQIILCQAIPRFSHLEWIVEKGTELGMNALWLFPGDKGEKKSLSAHQIERLHALSISALKQCGRFDLPSIVSKPPLVEWHPEEILGTLYFGDVHRDAPRLTPSLWRPSEKIFFAIGPEGGFSTREMALLRQWGGIGVSLHHNILRTETAALTALALLDQVRASF